MAMAQDDDARDAARLTSYPRTGSEKERELQELLDRAPDDLQTKKTLAFTYYTNQKFQAAAELYLQLSAHAADDPAVHFYLGNTLFRLKSFKAAMEAWRKAILCDGAGIYGDRARERIEMARPLVGGD